MKTIKPICVWIKNAKVARVVLIGSVAVAGVTYLGRYLLGFLLLSGLAEETEMNLPERDWADPGCQHFNQFGPKVNP